MGQFRARELALIVELDAAGYDITSLVGLNELVNLQSLILSANQIDGDAVSLIPASVRQLALDFNPLDIPLDATPSELPELRHLVDLSASPSMRRISPRRSSRTMILAHSTTCGLSPCR